MSNSVTDPPAESPIDTPTVTPIDTAVEDTSTVHDDRPIARIGFRLTQHVGSRVELMNLATALGSLWNPDAGFHNPANITGAPTIAGHRWTVRLVQHQGSTASLDLLSQEGVPPVDADAAESFVTDALTAVGVARNAIRVTRLRLVTD